MAMQFKDRTEAGRLLATKLMAYANRPDVLVLGLPRGGVPVAYEVAKALHVPLDICLVRKLGVPGHKELAMGAIASGGIRVLNQDVIDWVGISNSEIDRVAAQEQHELERRNHLYRGDRPVPDLHNQTVILVDDGIATGATLRAAIAALRQQNPAHLIVAVPVAPAEICQQLKAEVDDVICVSLPEALYAIGIWYDNFSQTTDDEVRNLLMQANHEQSTPSRLGGSAMDRRLGLEHRNQIVSVTTDSVVLEGNLEIPAGASGIILFAHGSGSSRHSPRNRYVADVLNQAGLATLLIDLLTPEEETIDLRTHHLRFDIGLLASRLVGATNWLTQNPATQALKIGYFGASTGAGAALVAAADSPHVVGAIVSRGGRPDLAGTALSRVQAPTLLIVGGYDTSVIQLNQVAQERLRCTSHLEIVPGATHLFEEPGALEEVARLASEWFQHYLISTDNHSHRSIQTV